MTAIIRRAIHLKHRIYYYHSDFLLPYSINLNGIKYKTTVENNEPKPHNQISDTKNDHLLTERQSATFNVEELTQFMFGGPGNYFEINTRRQIIRLALDHPIHGTHLPFEYLTADEYYSLTIRKSLLAIQEAKRLNITNNKHRRWFFDIFVNNRFVFFIHTIMSLHSLETMTTEEQKRQFLPLAQSFHITTAYAQTELGHGTDVQRLETEAVFDPTTDSFILNTPTLTSTKFWPGGLGRTVNHVLLMAQLYTPDRNHPCGLQMFLVQIRDLKTHEPLPGVETGVIGVHFAHTFGDNGYLRLKNVRIPRTQMLMKFDQVDEQGKFHNQSDARLLYGTLLHARIYLCESVTVALAQAITIAMRYSAVRFQGQNSNGNEIRILDYPLQQAKLIPCLSATYAFVITFMKLDNYFNELKTNEEIYLEQLPEIHALSSGFKAYTTLISERMAQVCRVACGGHGFLVGSGLVGIRNFLDAGCTAEGDNVVLLQETTRYLLKVMQEVEENNGKHIDSSVAYLSLPLWSSRTTMNLDDYCRVFESRSQLLIKEACNTMLELSSSPSSDEFLNNSIQLVHIANAHMETYLMRAFYEQVNKASQHPSISSILEQLFYVFAIHTLRNESADFIRFKLLSADQIYELETRTLPDMYSQLRPNLVALVDAFDFHDHELDSCLGRYDGQVYEALMERARLNPTNGHKVHPAWLSLKQGTLSIL
ncbi:unnamed protein product [Rotaria sordida]|uniref:Acyl-coenzyme A oxidase n=1 Tax=Rotaria sordida TaxID=392033 RepID=A0A815AB59_9BILA|nr:unnamed protein product [Rotaria sordida]CAF1534062.1 unnamed protein product [Rotaria sordida]